MVFERRCGKGVREEVPQERVTGSPVPPDGYLEKMAGEQLTTKQLTSTTTNYESTTTMTNAPNETAGKSPASQPLYSLSVTVQVFETRGRRIKR
jgi:hypothetical protein